MVTRDLKKKQWFWITPDLRQAVKVTAARRGMTLEAAYNEAVRAWINPNVKDEATGDLIRGDWEFIAALARMTRHPKSESDRLLILLLREILEKHYANHDGD